jgi:hypothetical protein
MKHRHTVKACTDWLSIRRSLVVRDCLINAGQGRPRSIDLKLADVSAITVLDFDGAPSSAQLFASYVNVSCILGECLEPIQVGGC